MGNFKFRLSDMIPNAWFYKLRDMNTTRNHNLTHPINKRLPSSTTTTSHNPNHFQPTHSYYYTPEPIRPTNPKASDTHFPDPPRKSSKRRTKRKTIYKPNPTLVTTSLSAECSCGSALNSIQAQDYSVSSTDSSHEPDPIESPLSEIGSDPIAGLASWSSSDIIINVNQKSYAKKTEKFDGFDSISETELHPIFTKPVNIGFSSKKIETFDGFDSISEKKLPPILTKPANPVNVPKESANFIRNSSKLEEMESVKQSNIKTQKEARKSVSYSAGLKLRANLPRIQVQGRKKGRRERYSAESFAIVKSSFDPEKDFMESMMEMIVENNIRASKDLEELLACYLSLNSDDYHDLIVKAFEKIWFNMPDHLNV